VNLRNKSYCIYNQRYSKEEYQKRLAALNIQDIAGILRARQEFEALRTRNIVPAYIQHHSVNSSGTWLNECKDVFNSFNCANVENGKYLMGISDGKDVMDFTYWAASSELIYESANIGRQCASVLFSNECWNQLRNAQYCINCHNSSNLFGCVGLRNKQYCILNKQYTKEQYEALVPRIIKHMNDMPYVDAKGRAYRYGEFFPSELSPFAYNETIAQEYFPLTKDEALAKGYKWRDPDTKHYTITKKPDDLPEHVKDVEDSILKETIGCAHAGECNHQCTTAFKIIPEELQFYRRMNLPLPRLCSNCRHYERLKNRNPMHLWRRPCMCAGARSAKSNVGIVYQNVTQHSHGDKPCPNEPQTSYDPARPEIVYCIDCFQAEVA
jgi:hypothetical protein